MRKRLPTILIAIILIAVAFGLFKYGISKNKVAIKELQAKHAAYTDSVNTARTVAQRLEEMNSRLRLAELQWEKATEMLPRAKEIPDLLTSITQAGARNNVSFQLFQPNPMVREDIYMALPIKVTIASRYHDLGSFLAEIGNLPRIVNVSELKVSSAGGEEVTNVSADFVATTYVLSEEKAAVATQQRRPSARRSPAPDTGEE
jgi:type IV pilus assembly protein PilO